MQNNPFLKSIEQFIDTIQRNTSIAHLSGPYASGEKPPKASWKDKAWQWKNNKGEKINFYFVDDAGMRLALSNMEKFTLLPSPEYEVLKAYALHLMGRDIGEQCKRGYILNARQFLSSNINLTSSRDAFSSFIEIHNLSTSKIVSLMYFCRWSKINQLISSNVKEVKVGRQRLSGDEVVANREKKCQMKK